MEAEIDSLRTGESGQAAADNGGLGRYMIPASWLIVVATLFLIPVKIIGYGYLPGGDARRHVAQAFTRKSFTEIVVMRPAYSMDNSPGWDGLLRALHEKAGWTKDGLMGFSIVALMLCIFLAPLPWLRRPEAWLAALLAQMVAIPEMMTRFSQARPYQITEGLCMIVLISWAKSGSKNHSWRKISFTCVAIGLSTWMHGAWYLWALPVAAFWLAGWWRAGFWLTVCWLAGAFGGALLTGRPVEFLRQALLIIGSISREHLPPWMLVGELTPHYGEFATLVLIALVFLARKQQGHAPSALFCAPLLAMIALCWILGFKADRCWADWGIPAVLVWMVMQFEELMAGAWTATSPKRLLAAGLLAAPFFLHSTNDLDRRYTRNLDEDFLNAADPALKDWLPEGNGIFYTANLGFYYSTFYKNPEADFRYILGFEPALMPDEDLKIYRDIQRTGALAAYKPWISKMRPVDRLAIYSSVQPDLPELEWHNAMDALWIGRPKK